MTPAVLRLGMGLGLRTIRSTASACTSLLAERTYSAGIRQEPARLVAVRLDPPLRAMSDSTRGFAPKRGRERAAVESDSDSDSDNEGSRRERGDSDFWRRKMRTLHGLLDINKDGVISFDDYKLLANRFVSLGHLSPQDTAEFQKSIQKMWEEQWGSMDPYNLVTTEQYLTEMHHMLNDKSLKNKAHLFLPYLFKAVDKDKSGEISVEEFKLFFECLGLSEQDAIATFNVIDTNTDGRLSLKEFVKLGKDFFHTEDERKPSKMFWGPLVP